MKFVVTQRILKKLKEKHDVSWEEVEECFLNRQFCFLEDTRLQHKTHPPTLWFISETDDGRKLKIIFIECENGDYELKSAYKPNKIEETIYEKNI